MAIIAVVRIEDDELDRTIVAEMNDYCPEGFYFVELPPNHTWINGKIVNQMVLLTGEKELVEFQCQLLLLNQGLHLLSPQTVKQPLLRPLVRGILVLSTPETLNLKTRMEVLTQNL